MMSQITAIKYLVSLDETLAASGVPFDHPHREALRLCRETAFQPQSPQPTERKEVWIIEARHTTQNKPAFEIAMLFPGTLQEATEQAVQYVCGMTAPITVSGIRRLGFAVEVAR